MLKNSFANFKFSMYQLKWDPYHKKMTRLYRCNDFENIRDLDMLIKEVTELFDKQPDFMSEYVKEKRSDFFGNLLDHHMDLLFDKQKMSPAELKKVKTQAKKKSVVNNSLKSFELRRKRVSGEIEDTR